MINWDCNAKDFELIDQIAQRVEADIPSYPDDRRTIIMDLTACHANGCPLQLAELLAADRFEFAHDILGIRRHIDRSTGKLQDCFVPRYAKSEVTA